MSKSRSNEEKDREKVRDKEKEREIRNRMDENAEDSSGEEEPTWQRQINQLQLSGESEADLKSPMVDVAAGLVSQKKAMISSSPPPSYEHVLEQTRMEQEAGAQKQEGEHTEERQETVWVEKRAANGAALGTEQRTPAKGPEILHKSSKEFYRAMAKQWGITCKMSDHCRCLDCQSHYFDCEYEKNEHQKTDGGLGAGTPMFISEVMQGSGCLLL